VREWVSNAIDTLSVDPYLQGVIVACCTFILEDPTTLASALLVADGRMLYWTALIGLSMGIGIGDWGLYALGRFVGPKTLAWGLVSERRLERAGAWFERNLVVAIFVSRFVPGLRLPMNIGAGMIQASPMRYLPMALVASLVWTFLALSAISKLGEAVLPLLGALKWPVAIAMLLTLVLVQRYSIKRFERLGGHETGEGNVASSFEFWHPVVFYAPVAAYYFWLALRHRSLTLPTVSNPAIYSGGMIGESKSEILAMVSDTVREQIAPCVAFDTPDDGSSAEEQLVKVRGLLDGAGLALPIVAKPDRGQRGLGVRRIETEEDLRKYLDDFPRGSRICFQELVAAPEEAGFLYYRYPGEAKGRIASVTLKEFPYVTGDGERSLRELIVAHPRACLMKGVFFKRHAAELDRVLDDGERFQLVFAGNHKQGCVFRDGADILTPALESCIDEIAQAIPGFYFGRFDVRFDNLDALRKGEGFRIIEINGAGAEATHIWDPDAKLGAAYRTLFEQFRVLFEIGAANRAKGHRPLGPTRFLRDVLSYHRVARRYPSAQ